MPRKMSFQMPLTVVGLSTGPITCWDATGFPNAAETCGELSELRDVIEKRLYVVDQCRKQIAGDYATGHLDLGMELDFEGGSLSFWSKPTTRIPKGVNIAECMTAELKGMSLGELGPKFARYHFALTVAFGRPGDAVAAVNPKASLKRGDVTPEQIEQGRIVAVIRDRVRVRKAPIDGEILGKISSGNRVLLIEESDGWCHVKTPRGNIGWMVCWALAL